VIPSVEEGQRHLFQEVCRDVQAAQVAREAALRVRDQTKDPEARKTAEEAFQASDRALKEAVLVAVETASPILDQLDTFLQTNDFDHWFMPCAILTEASPLHLANYAARGTEYEARVEDFLLDIKLQRAMLDAGGANDGKYPEAVEIYQSILRAMDVTNKGNPTLQRLALGIAVELAVPKAEFDTPDIFIDPVKRYLHYEQAYLHGELDPAFGHFTTFHYRYATNCDAPNEQLGWAREMLRNYRPDLAMLGTQRWRYIFLVRSDMGYNQPDYQGHPRTYPQMLSGGGQCGPRAWMGRFMCQAFGIPIWGVRQPGHAAVSRWTPSGWAICLGADWPWSYWQGRCGTDFKLESLAREHGGDQYITVNRLEWVANGVSEPKIDVGKGIVHPDRFWGSLALCQKSRLAEKTGGNETQCKRSEAPQAVVTLAERVLQSPLENGRVTFQEDGVIVVPATACSQPKSSTTYADYQRSYLGGKQLYLKEAGVVEYVLDAIPETKTYKLSLRIVNVHSKQQPLLITISSFANPQQPVTIVSVDVPYTIGEWHWTDPVEVELTQGSNHITLSRETPNKGLSFKDMTFTPYNKI
jgi:hypothetical protein